VDGETEGGGFTRVRVTEGEWAGWSCFPGSDPFEDLIGRFYVKRGEDGARICGFRAEARHMNGQGGMHGGCIMTFADYALFMIAADALRDTAVVTAAFTCELVGQVREGDRLEAKGEVVKAGRSLVFVRGLVVNVSAGETAAAFSGTLKKLGVRP
jgi:uncharacterized protein (TIGR00369 family)